MNRAGSTQHRAAVAQAYRAYGHSVLRRARQILGGDQEADDVLQEIFMSLLDRPEQFAERSSLGTFLYAATTHLCLNRLRNRRNRERLLADHVTPLSAEKVAASPETMMVLRELLARVPEDQARAAVHYYLDGMSHAEIAVQLGCSRRHVGDLLERLQARMVRVARADRSDHAEE